MVTVLGDIIVCIVVTGQSLHFPMEVFVMPRRRDRGGESSVFCAMRHSNKYRNIQFRLHHHCKVFSDLCFGSYINRKSFNPAQTCDKGLGDQSPLRRRGLLRQQGSDEGA